MWPKRLLHSGGSLHKTGKRDKLVGFAIAGASNVLESSKLFAEGRNRQQVIEIRWASRHARRRAPKIDCAMGLDDMQNLLGFDMAKRFLEAILLVLFNRTCQYNHITIKHWQIRGGL